EQRVQRTRERRWIDGLVKRQEHRLIVVMGLGRWLLEEPALDRRERGLAGDGALLGRRVAALLRDGRETRDRGALEELPRGEMETLLARARPHLDAQDRVPAEREEVLVDADAGAS